MLLFDAVMLFEMVALTCFVLLLFFIVKASKIAAVFHFFEGDCNLYYMYFLF